MSEFPKCLRPNCPNSGHPSRRGLCSKHRAAQLKDSGRAMGYTDVEPVIAHLRLLQRSGLSIRCVSERSGLSHFGIALILAGERRRVRAETARKLLAIEPDSLTQAYDGALIPAVGTVRRLRALHAIGYTGTALAKMLGAGHGDMARVLLTGSQPNVRAATARRVAEIFRDLQLKPLPPSRTTSRAINRAKSLGWALPLEWDEDAIDDPSAQPFKAALSDEDFARQYEKWRARGYDNARIAELLGVRPRSLTKRLWRTRRREAA